MRMTDQSSGSSARGRRRTSRRTQEAPETNRSDEARPSDDFGAGVDDSTDAWESRAKDFEASPGETSRGDSDRRESSRSESNRGDSDRAESNHADSDEVDSGQGSSEGGEGAFSTSG